MKAVVTGAWVVSLSVMWGTLGWTLMLATGVAHRHWWVLMPPMGWKTAFILAGLSVLCTVTSVFVSLFLQHTPKMTI